MERWDEVVVITGASSGVGRATAEALARKGCTLLLAARRGDELVDVARRCRESGARDAIAVPTDVADTEAVERLARRAEEAFGRIDVWVNCAAVAAFGPLAEVPPDIFRRIIETNVLGCVNGARAALRTMSPRGSGTVINFSSAVAPAPVPYNTAYVLSKAAIRSFGATLRQELRLAGRRGVHVCTVIPASLDTPFFTVAGNYSGRKAFPIAPVYTAERAARTVLSLVRGPRREAFVGPAAGALDVLSRVSPGLLERLLGPLTDRAQLSRRESAPRSAGSVQHPFPADAVDADDSGRGGAVDGGWHGRRRTALRRAAAGTSVTAAAVLAAWGVSSSRGGRGRAGP
ncbi:SDR family oxidoreductase [Streptomyces montanisoli]|uniref:SDR family NAD(P)-dependent oxidoreductase n=1 Tax=Streptomyces montanisoli TaxID=2798581 RepID=A0A940MBF5_9ACTN|nr:SDR family oxidoreductase [Streptomyces montanisoli]MBP0459854.1 SDR family NAD(P)-dependent oxidoreductase [Streptomyces montanisoli]